MKNFEKIYKPIEIGKVEIESMTREYENKKLEIARIETYLTKDKKELRLVTFRMKINGLVKYPTWKCPPSLVEENKLTINKSYLMSFNLYAEQHPTNHNINYHLKDVLFMV